MSQKPNGKKVAVLAVMVLLLGGAVYLNYYAADRAPLTSTGGQTAESAPTTQTTAVLGESQFVSNTTAAQDYFSTVRQDREAAREDAMAVIQETLQGVKLDEATKQEMVTLAAEVAKALDQENAVESLVKAKGYDECVVFIEEDRCHVAVKADNLSEAETLQIAQIVMAQTDVPSANINILAVA